MSDNGDRMFCHACGGVWLRDHRGLSCPHCESDFTEIIEIPPDTNPDLYGEDPSTLPHERNRPLSNPWAGHNPWVDEEPGPHDYSIGNGFRHRTYRSPDGRFTLSSTTFGHGFPDRSTGSPRGVPGDPLMPMVRSLDTIFHGLADTYRHQGRRGSQGEPGQGAFAQDDPDREREPDYGPGRRLYPRDANGPQPMAPPFGTLGDILDLFRADFGGGTGGPGGPGGGVRVMTGPNPLAMLSTLLNFDQHGDAVYSQEELDRVISQLIDQNMNGTAPPPASQDSIRSLPKKKVDEEMLGNEGKAECSICMDPVQLGTEVTVLPCKHWFHYNCIEMWLNQHNTCPHCRRPINAQAQQEGSRDNPIRVHDSPEATSPRRRHRPSATPLADYGGDFSWTGNHRPMSHSESDGHERRRSSGNHSNNGGGGITSWIRSRFGGGT